LEQPPPLDANEPPPPPPPPVEVPKIATTKFLPPIIKKDEDVLVEEAPPIVEEIKGNTAVVTQEGVESTEIPVEAPPVQEVGERQEEAVLWVAEKQSFKGGDLNKFLSKEIRYPTQAQNQGISGRVVVEFVIERDGSVSNVKTIKGIGSGCDAEAERVIKLTNGMWSPGKNNGHAVRLKMIQPIFFKVPEGN
jgi:protein TonB